MPNYQNAKIYKLICSETNKVYIGSTVTTLNRRKLQHTYSYNSCTSKDFINPEIYLIENFPCSNKEELHNKEREYIENTDCVNIVVPCQTRKEYYENNKERQKDYQEKNKEKIKAYKQCYHEKNKKELNKKSREYKKDNKQELSKKAREKMTCECGSVYNRKNKSRHLKTKKHQIFTIKNLI